MLHAMCLPKDPDDYTTAQIVDKLEHAYVKKTLKDTEWANYFSLKQESGESLLEFSNRLRKKAFNCAFPADVLEGNMKATFLNGLENDATRMHLSSKEYSTLEKALEFAEQYEISRSSRRNQNAADVVAKVNGGEGRGRPTTQNHRRGEASWRSGRSRERGGQEGVSDARDSGGTRRKSADGGRGCYGCGDQDHMRADCWAKDVKCRNCGKRGHIAKVCRAEPRERQEAGRKTLLVEDEFDVMGIQVAEEYDVLPTFSPRRTAKHWRQERQRSQLARNDLACLRDMYRTLQDVQCQLLELADVVTDLKCPKENPDSVTPAAAPDERGESDKLTSHEKSANSHGAGSQDSEADDTTTVCLAEDSKVVDGAEEATERLCTTENAEPETCFTSDGVSRVSVRKKKKKKRKRSKLNGNAEDTGSIMLN
ncbi:uncharacterized protein LOC129600226 [Paramacrobiotus metropolitanus]|uniref:uncharacterized protein LOC129600226 n=1 Tax=Paramacrobiotus metropolitanus TaxID=2943436 RepID=UPI0024464D80|nr:uncharacterized protein LOC129600226 [Paramacrobiotus metropolitanus]